MQDTESYFFFIKKGNWGIFFWKKISFPHFEKEPFRMGGVYKNCVTFVTMCKVVVGRFSCQPKISAANFCQNIKISKQCYLPPPKKLV
jgi:hypothetical protein